MDFRSWLLVVLAGALTACPFDPDFDRRPPLSTGTETGGSDPNEPDTEAFEVPLGQIYELDPIHCAGAWPVPPELLGDDGLGFHAWTVDDIHLSNAGSSQTEFTSSWISDNDDSDPSLRVRPWLVPEFGACYREHLIANGYGYYAPTPVLETLSAFARGDRGYDELTPMLYQTSVAGYLFPGSTPVAKSLHAVLAYSNPLPGAPAAEAWTPELEAELLAKTEGIPEDMQDRLARLILSLIEANELALLALEAHPYEDWHRIWQQFLVEDYTGVQNSHVSPVGGTVITDIEAMAEDLRLEMLVLAGQRLSEAAGDISNDAPELYMQKIDLQTSVGRIVIQANTQDNNYTAEDLAGVALLVDYGGNDTYAGQYASTAAGLWMSAGVVVDVAGNDIYGVTTPDIEDSLTTAEQAFDVLDGFTQGCGLFGVGILHDHGGDDSYAASVYSQGAGAFGVGVLYDRDGEDRHQLGHFGQGAGYFGVGLLLNLEWDGAGGNNDYYGVYTGGQGLGKPRGHGLLLDHEGDDIYVAYYEADGAYLPGPSFNNYYGLDATWPYARDGVPHFMSLAQGVGWGYRSDWGLDNNWMGGFGVLFDMGQGDDQYLADTFSKGMGFMYGLGFLSDEGGEDRYRSFWFGPAAGAHMGVGLLDDLSGNDDYFVTQASGGLGYDYGVSWLLDRAGDDRYGGALHLGEGNTGGHGYFVDHGGADTYNPDDPLANLGPSATYGHVRNGVPGLNLIGVFLDLGGAQDVYGTDVVEIGNDAVWHLAPIGDDVDPALHKGVGIDR
jgi:hypothetical protein